MLDLGAGLPGIDPLCQVAVAEEEAVVVVVVFVDCRSSQSSRSRSTCCPGWQNVCQGAEEWAAGKDGDRKFDKVLFVIIIYYYYFFYYHYHF